MTEFTPSVGMYAMHHMHNCERGTLVRIESEPRPGHFGIEYVPCGGASYSWPAAEFRPVTEPRLLAVCRLHAIRRDKREAELRVRALEAEEAKWTGVVQVFDESSQGDACERLGNEMQAEFERLMGEPPMEGKENG